MSRPRASFALRPPAASDPGRIAAGDSHDKAPVPNGAARAVDAAAGARYWYSWNFRTTCGVAGALWPSTERGSAVRAYISLGSNLGDGPARLAAARSAVAALPGVRVAAESSVYRTEPQGRKEQPWFVNQVLGLECDPDLTADALLEALLDIEIRLGRVRDPADRFGPRAIDLDLLLFGDEVRTADPRLLLPHPRLAERAFVLVPLREIAPGLILPAGRRVKDLERALPHTVEGDRIFQ